MNNKKTISYTKNGEEINGSINYFNKKSLVKKLFDESCILGKNCENYVINDSVEYLYLKNVVFLKNVRFTTPKDTIVILENCIFKGGRMDFNGGNIEIINPKLISCQYTNYIYFSNVNDLNIMISKDNMSFISLKGTANNFTLNTEKNIDIIDHLSIKANNIKIIGVTNPKILELDANKISLEKSNIHTNDKNDMKAKKIELHQSSINSQKNDINTENLLLDRSKIYFSWCMNKEGINWNNIILKESTITSEDHLSINSNDITMDDTSKFKVGESIQIKNIIYTSKSEETYLELDKKAINQRYIVSILKEIKNNLELNNKVKTKQRH